MRLSPPFFLLVLLLCTSGRRAWAQGPVVLHVATGGKESDAQVYYAQDLGYFGKAGLTVEISTMASGGVIASAVAGGSIQIGSSNIVAIAAARSRGLPFVFIAPGAEYRDTAPTTQLCVAPNSPIRSGKDLNGKTVGTISLKALDQSSVQAWIDRHGGDSSTVRFVEVTTSEMPAALERGTIQAAQIAEPVLSAEHSRLRCIGKTYSEVAKRFMISGWFARSDWVTRNADIVRRFNEAIAESARWANANPRKAAAILEKYSKIPPNPNETHLTYALSLDPTMIQPVIDLATQYKILTRPLPASDLIAQLPE
jgi:NitT/TauT family transport system substrate-binding protein